MVCVRLHIIHANNKKSVLGPNLSQKSALNAERNNAGAKSVLLRSLTPDQL
jgi:hypothetical protein